MGQVGGQGGKGADQGGQVLAGLDRAQAEQVRAVQAETPAQVGHLGIAGRAQVGAEGVTSTRSGGTPSRSARSAAVVADTHRTRVALATARRIAQPK